MRSRGQLVDPQGAVGVQEEFDGQDADRPQRLGHGEGQRPRLLGDDRADGRGHEGRIQDVPLVAVEADGKGRGKAVGPADDHDRDLRRELDPSLGHARDPPEARPGRFEVVGPLDADLPLAVVARGGRLEDQRQAEDAGGLGQLRFVPDRPPGRERQAVPGEERLLAEPVLADPDRPPARPDEPPPREPSEGRGRDVLELDGDRLGPLREGRGGRADGRAARRSPRERPGRRGRPRSRSGRSRDTPSAAPPGGTSGRAGRRRSRPARPAGGGRGHAPSYLAHPPGPCGWGRAQRAPGACASAYPAGGSLRSTPATRGSISR